MPFNLSHISKLVYKGDSFFCYMQYSPRRPFSMRQEKKRKLYHQPLQTNTFAFEF